MPALPASSYPVALNDPKDPPLAPMRPVQGAPKPPPWHPEAVLDAIKSAALRGDNRGNLKDPGHAAALIYT